LVSWHANAQPQVDPPFGGESHSCCVLAIIVLMPEGVAAMPIDGDESSSM
jgi:hypothetical protein